MLKLEKLRVKLSGFRDIVNEYNNDLLLLGQEQQRASNPKGIDDIVKRKVEWTFETTGSFQNDVEHITRHYLALFELSYLNLPQRYNAAREAEQLAKDIFQRINFWKMIDQVPEREEGFSRLIRKVEISKDVRTSPTFPAPKYVLPLGKLSQQKDADSPWTCLDKIVLMDITSPQKALWEFSSFGPGRDPCHVLQLLAADIKDICPPKSNTSCSNTTQQVHKQDLSSPMALLQVSKYKESFFMVPVGEISFNPAPKDNVAEAIRRGWGHQCKWRALVESVEATKIKSHKIRSAGRRQSSS